MPLMGTFTAAGVRALRSASGLPSRIYNTPAIAQTTNATSYTFNNVPIDAATARSLVAIGFSAFDATASDTGVTGTIGGSAATVYQSAATGGTKRAIVGFLYLSGVTGTTTTVVINTPSTARRCVIFPYSFYNLNSTTPHHSAESGSTAGVSSRSVALNIPQDGLAVAVGGVEDNFATVWTGLTEDDDVSSETTQHSSASAQSMTAETGRTITATWSGANAFAALAALSFR